METVVYVDMLMLRFTYNRSKVVETVKKEC